MKVLEGNNGKKKHRLARILVRVGISAFLVYAVVFSISQQVQISQKQTELQTLQDQLDVQNLQNEELKEALDAGVAESSDYIERLARKSLDFAKPSEKIFVNISGE
jgi:cell division protein FtsB